MFVTFQMPLLNTSGAHGRRRQQTDTSGATALPSVSDDHGQLVHTIQTASPDVSANLYSHTSANLYSHIHTKLHLHSHMSTTSSYSQIRHPRPHKHSSLTHAHTHSNSRSHSLLHFSSMHRRGCERWRRAGMALGASESFHSQSRETAAWYNSWFKLFSIYPITNGPCC